MNSPVSDQNSYIKCCKLAPFSASCSLLKSRGSHLVFSQRSVGFIKYILVCCVFQLFCLVPGLFPLVIRECSVMSQLNTSGTIEIYCCMPLPLSQ